MPSLCANCEQQPVPKRPSTKRKLHKKACRQRHLAAKKALQQKVLQKQKRRQEQLRASASWQKARLAWVQQRDARDAWLASLNAAQEPAVPEPKPKGRGSLLQQCLMLLRAKLPVYSNSLKMRLNAGRAACVRAGGRS
jgi:hypothetical protein